MISAELASKVLNKDVKKVSLLNKTSMTVNVTYFPHEDMNYTRYDIINIYELAWKCKNYVGEKYNMTILELPYEVSAHWFDEDEEKEMAHYVTGEEKPYDVERVFKCCEWILKESK